MGSTKRSSKRATRKGRTRTKRMPKFSPYKPIERGKATVVFDLDETLLETKGVGTSSFDGSVDDYALTPSAFPPHSLCTILVDKRVDHDKKRGKCGDVDVTVSVVHFRPYAVDLLNYCFEHFNVAFWSSAMISYVRKVVSRLTRLCGKTEADVCFAWGRGMLRRPRYKDAFTGAPIAERSSERENVSYRKPMHQIWDTYPSVDRKHLILFDNLPNHMVASERENHVYVPPFSYMNANDTILRQLLDVIRKNVGKGKGKGKGSDKDSRASNALTSSDLRSIESASPLNDGSSVSGAYNRSPSGFTRPDTSTLPRGQEVAVFYANADRVLPAVICKQPKEGENYALVEVHYAKRHTHHGIQELSMTSDPRSLVRSGVITRERRRVPIHMILGPLSLVSSAYGLNDGVEQWRQWRKTG